MTGATSVLELRTDRRGTPGLGAWRVTGRAIRGHWLRLGLACAAGAALYYAGLIGVMALRLGQLPNFGRVYPAVSAYALIWTSTPSARDALAIMADEPLFELGYKMPEFGISEWSLMVTLPNLLQVLGGCALLSTFVLLSGLARRAGCAPRRRVAVAAGTGASLLALCSASLTWVVCCATPSWVVALSVLGVSLTLAQLLGPFDLALLVVGSGIAIVAVASQARRLARLGPDLQAEPAPGARVR